MASGGIKLGTARGDALLAHGRRTTLPSRGRADRGRDRPVSSLRGAGRPRGHRDGCRGEEPTTSRFWRQGGPR
jgi:hypothetical protein